MVPAILPRVVVEMHDTEDMIAMLQNSTGPIDVIVKEVVDKGYDGVVRTSGTSVDGVLAARPINHRPVDPRGVSTVGHDEGSRELSLVQGGCLLLCSTSVILAA